MGGQAAGCERTLEMLLHQSVFVGMRDGQPLFPANPRPTSAFLPNATICFWNIAT